MKKIVSIALLLASGVTSAQVYNQENYGSGTPNTTSIASGDLILEYSAADTQREKATAAQLNTYIQSQTTPINALPAASSLSATDVSPFYIQSATATQKVTGTQIATFVASTLGANPTGIVGLSAVNGSANTFMRSDAAPPIDQTITPTWTGIHTFSGAEVRIKFNETGQAANTGNFDIDVLNGALCFRTRTDADGAGVSPLCFQNRSGTSIQDVIMGTPNNTVDFSTSGKTTFNGTVISNNANPNYDWFENDQASGSREWRSIVLGGLWQLDASDDNGGTRHIAISVARTSGTSTVTALTYGNATDLPSHTFQGPVTYASHTNNSGTAPAVSACGTGPSIDAHATDNSGTVTVGTVAAASCTVTFATAYTTWNHCRVTSQSVIASFAYSYTKTAITVTGTSLIGDVFDYQCDGS